ncbi:hypothetical protein D3C86_1815930 [compost metagenome]
MNNIKRMLKEVSTNRLQCLQIKFPPHSNLRMGNACLLKLGTKRPIRECEYGDRNASLGQSLGKLQDHGFHTRSICCGHD